MHLIKVNRAKEKIPLFDKGEIEHTENEIIIRFVDQDKRKRKNGFAVIINKEELKDAYHGK